MRCEDRVDYKSLHLIMQLQKKVCVSHRERKAFFNNKKIKAGRLAQEERKCRSSSSSSEFND